MCRLTPKQQVIIKLLCEGLRNQEIAEWTGLSLQRVKTHLHEIRIKSGLPEGSPNTAVVFWYLTQGMCDYAGKPCKQLLTSREVMSGKVDGVKEEVPQGH